jgi:hypothetical protein
MVVPAALLVAALASAAAEVVASAAGELASDVVPESLDFEQPPSRTADRAIARIAFITGSSGHRRAWLLRPAERWSSQAFYRPFQTYCAPRKETPRAKGRPRAAGSSSLEMAAGFDARGCDCSRL